MKKIALRILGGLAVASALAGSAAGQTPLTLFNGTSMLGWNPRGFWTTSAGLLATSGTVSRGITSAVPFANFSLVFDYNETTPMQAKLRLWAPKEGAGGAYVDLDMSGAGAKVGGVEGATPSPLPIVGNGWHHVQVEAMQGGLSVRVDGAQAGTSSGVGVRAGYLGWEVNGNGTFQVRNVKLIPRSLTPAFNGTDLGGWKMVAHDPAASGGIGHTMIKTMTFGIGGGSTKPHSAKWTVQAGAMHGEDGPGGLEYSTPVEDAIVELTAQVKGSIKQEHFTGVGLRDQAGKLGGGYLVGVGPYSGGIDDLVKRPLGKNGSRVQETIVIAGRTMAVWEAGNLVTVHTDPRPESDRVSVGAKTTGGALTLILPEDSGIDVQQIAMVALPKGYGSAVAIAPPPPPTPTAATVATSAVPAGASAAETALLQQQATTVKQQQDDRTAKQKVAGLMASALATTDPQQQMNLYQQVVQLDPSNVPAVQGYKDAQSKAQSIAAAQAQAIAAQSTADQNTQTREQQVNGSIVKAQSAMFAGHVAEASSALMVAERLAPDNPIARDLRNRINATSSLHTRLLYLGSGAGILGLVALGIVWFRRKRLKRYPMLEQTQGLDVGTLYPLEKDTVKIGAVAQDGGQKNDIVIRDVEHAISRFHCEVTRQNNQLYVTDLSSRNGTKLEGKTLPAGQPMLLRTGGRILLADSVELRFGYARGEQTKS